MVCTVRRYTGPLVLYSCTSSRSVCSPPRTAGYTTSRTASAGRASEASAMANRMFSLPVTRRNALTSSPVTFRSARAPIRCTVAISTSTRLSVTSRSRPASSAASKVTADCGEFGSRRRKWEGDSTAARARHPDITFGATSANKPGGRPTARIAVSLRISVSIDSRLTFPGTDLISASRHGPSTGGTAARQGDHNDVPVRAVCYQASRLRNRTAPTMSRTAV